MTGKPRLSPNETSPSTVARGMDPDALKRPTGSGAPPPIIDVRRDKAYRQSGLTTAGAIGIAPEMLADDTARIDRHRVVVAVCVHGHEVSQGAAAALRQRRVDACFPNGRVKAIRQRRVLPVTRIADSEGIGGS